MTILVVGASGATGRQLVAQLLAKGNNVKVVVRSPEKLPESWKDNQNVKIIEASILELSDQELNDYVHGCDAIASCLGHNITLKGVYGEPKRLVKDATRRLCDAITAYRPEQKIKYVLMNTTGNRNRDLNEPLDFRTGTPKIKD